MNNKITNWIDSVVAAMRRTRGRGLRFCALVIVFFCGLVGVILEVSRPATNSPAAKVSGDEAGKSEFVKISKSPKESKSIFNAGSLLQTSSQRKQQEVTEKSDELARLISRMPGVEDASVLIQPGAAGRLGKKAVRATAVVYVDFDSDTQMNSDLLKSVVVLVSGSVSGLDEKAIRIVTARGLSYKLDDVGVLPGDVAVDLAIKQKQEIALRKKISQALGYIPDLGVAVSVKSQESQWAASEIVVNVPRSFAENIYDKSEASKSGGQRDEIITSIMNEQTQRIREIITLTGGKGADIVVQWYYPPQVTAKDAAGSVNAGVVALIGALAFGECVIVALLVAIRVRRRQRRKAWARLRSMARRRRKAGQGHNDFDFLRLVGEDELVILLKQEKPLAVALALANLSAAKAASVLGRLGNDMQIEIARRMAGIENVAAEVSRNIARRLIQRMEIIVGNSNADGVAAVARILQHSNQAGRKKVLEALRQQEPRLAESIGRLLVSFEDIAEMSRENLAPALESMQIEEIAAALWSSSENVQRNVFESMPIERTKEVMVKMQGMSNVRPAQIETAQQQLVELIRDCEVAKNAIAKANEKVLA